MDSLEPSSTDYADWKAPAEDGQTLIWPDPGQVLRDTIENGDHLRAAAQARVQNLPLPEVRAAMRRFLGYGDERQPIVATGHQTELYHPGVWVKDALIDAAARRLGGRAVHFAVDTDAPKHLALRWPGASEPLTDDPAATAADWAGQVAPPTPAHLKHLSDSLAQASASWGFEPLAFRFLDQMRRLSLESTDLPPALTNSLHELDWSLRLRHEAMLISPVCLSEPYLAFVHHVLANADRFAADYNGALGEYRREHRIRAEGRPMPNLKVEADACEAPFWFDDLREGARFRAAVSRGPDGGGWTLRPPPGAAGEPFALDPAADGWSAAAALANWLRRHNARLAPRALTLTTFLRLLVADQFVHGIGGGRYDQVTDRLIARHFGLRPPRFCVTTATLYFPGAAQRSRVCLPCVVHEGHRLRHSLLGEEKMRLVEAIAAEPRRSPQRTNLFYEMHNRLEVAAAEHPAIREWEEQRRQTERREQEERTIFDRELFYAIQPAERLSRMIAQYAAAFGA